MKVNTRLLAFASLWLAGSPCPAESWFRLGETNGRPVLLTPEGKPFWSLGVCCTNTGQDWETDHPENPSYRAFKLFPNAKAWVQDTETKLRAWGFNTLGGWSSDAEFRKFGSRMPYTVVLHLGAWNKAPWKDIFTEETERLANQAAKDQIGPIRDDPNLIGYFTDNELGWWTDTIFLHYLQNLRRDEPGRIRAHAELKSFYKGDFSAFRKDWKTTATSWEAFDQDPTLALVPGGHGIAAVSHWMSVLGEYYGKLVSNAIRKNDPNHLNLGERYVQFYNQPYAQAAGRYCDVVSTNAGSSWNDGTYSHFFLQSLHELTGKPIIITEFYMAAEENRSGNKNSGEAFPKVKTQEDRGLAFRKCLDSLAARPYVIGAHWFQFYDEPSSGRGDGEDFNMGLVDIFGKPYTELTDRAQSFRAFEVPTLPTYDSGKSVAKKWTPARPTPASLRDWPRDAAYVESTSKTPFADLYATWDTAALRLGVYMVDYMDAALYENKTIPESERATLKIDLDGKALTVRFGGQSGGGKSKVDLAATLTGKARIVESPNLSHTLIVEIAKSDLPFQLKPGAQHRLRATLSNHSRMNTINWDTLLTLKP